MTGAGAIVGLALTIAVASGGASGAPGDLDPGFGDEGVVAGGLLDVYGPVDVDADGRVVVLGHTDDGTPAVARYLPDGSPDTSFGGDGRAEVAVPGVGWDVFAVRALADGAVVAIGIGREDPDDPFSLYVYAARFTAAGAPASEYGTNGVEQRDVAGAFDAPLAASIAPDGVAVVSFTVGGPWTGFERVSSDGTFTAFEASIHDAAEPPGQTGCSAQGFRPVSTAFVSTDRFAHAGDVFYICDGGQFEYPVVSVQPIAGGAAVWSTALPADETMGDEFRRSPVAFVGGSVVVASLEGDSPHVRRFSATTGAIDTGFGDGGVASLFPAFGPVGDIDELAGGRIGLVNAGGLHAPDQVRITRLLPSGAVDPAFPTVATPVGSELRRTALAGAPDAGILVTSATDSASALRRYDGGPAPLPGALTPLQPGRLLDTRQPGGATVDGQFQAQGTQPADATLALQVAGRGGVPADAAAVVLNVTVVQAQGAGFVTAWPCDEPRPDASSLNFTDGQTVPNAVIVKLAGDGTVCLFNAQAATDLLADVNGYFPGGSGFEPLQPGRLLDTRQPGGATVDGQFQAQGAPPADGEIPLVVGGRAGVPADAAAVVLNVTVVQAQGAGFVTAWPCDEPRPDASSLNFTEGQTVPNAVVAKVSAAGTVCLFNAQASADLLADVNGYFPAGSGFESLQPGRLLDTRQPGGATIDGEFQAQGAQPADGELALQVAGRGGVPDGASAAVLNVTVVGAQGAGFVTAWPCDEPRPDASSLNFTDGQTVPNAVVVKLSPAGTVCLFNAQAATDLLADVNGYFP